MAAKKAAKTSTANRRRDDFKGNIPQKLAERAGYICSKPDCRRMTVGPSAIDPTKSVKSGRAAHICAASPGGPRYDPNQTEGQRSGIGNGIWVCPICSDIIDKDVEEHFDAKTLRRWRTKHESMVNELRLREDSVFAVVRKNSLDAEVAQRITTFLDDKGALFEPIEYELQQHVVDSLKEIRNGLQQYLDQLAVDGDLYQRTERIRTAAQEYMKSTSRPNPGLVVWEDLEVMRKKIGLILKRFVDQYRVKVGPRLATILPTE